jgi:predicted nucleic acid-binding protein
MSYLLDTNAISEWIKPLPNMGLIRWTEEVDEDRVFLSVISLAELHHGVERLPAGKRRARLEQWLLHQLPQRFEKRIIPIDEGIAATWGKLAAQSERLGRPMGVMDGFLAATAIVRELTLITRNISDFALLKAVHNPWSE